MVMGWAKLRRRRRSPQSIILVNVFQVFPRISNELTEACHAPTVTQLRNRKKKIQHKQPAKRRQLLENTEECSPLLSSADMLQLSGIV